MTNILTTLFTATLSVSLVSFGLWIITMIISALYFKRSKVPNDLSKAGITIGVTCILSFIGLLLTISLETTKLPEPKISSIEKDFFYISKTENTDIDLGMFSLIIFGEIGGELTSNNDLTIFYRSEENEIIDERIESENLKFLIVENAEDEKIVIETHTYYEQQNYYSPPKIEEDYVETHYKLYVTEKTFKGIFE